MTLVRRLTSDQKRTTGHWLMELVVVAGVIIALWLQEWAQRRQALQNMNSAEDAIHDEVRNALTSIALGEQARDIIENPDNPKRTDSSRHIAIARRHSTDD